MERMIKVNNIIFLDINGPLVTHDYLVKEVKDNNGVNDINFQFNFCPVSLENLKQIVDATNARIVITSTWRTSRNSLYHDPLRKYWTAILHNLEKVNLRRRIFDITPLLGSSVSRGDEILAWLKKYYSYINSPLGRGIRKFVILDDDHNMGILIDHLVLCGPSGITDEV